MKCVCHFPVFVSPVGNDSSEFRAFSCLLLEVDQRMKSSLKQSEVGKNISVSTMKAWVLRLLLVKAQESFIGLEKEHRR